MFLYIVKVLKALSFLVIAIMFVINLFIANVMGRLQCIDSHICICAVYDTVNITTPQTVCIKLLLDAKIKVARILPL